jgi:hypothetical protein
MDAPQSGSGMVDPTVSQGLYITMASALEGLGRLDECGRYHDMALELVGRIGHVSGPVMTCYCRRARMLHQAG